jgi:uncharacterized coiled-coil protein SlyX
MNPMFKAMKVKKKRAVDPNAPPRPTLLGHEKVLKDAKTTIERQEVIIDRLQYRMDELERKLANQTAFLNALYQRISSK